MAINRNIPVVKITYKNRGNSLFHLLRVEKMAQRNIHIIIIKIFNTFQIRKEDRSCSGQKTN